jgi:biofilm PGA synthesis N-glycosyltransferase PgaC
MHEAAGIFITAVLAVMLYSYAGYPLVLRCLGAVRRRKVRVDESYLPRVALIVSAHDEERVIREKLENSLALDYPRDRFRIVVASDGSIDGTNAIVREYESRLVALKAFDPREGKNAALNRAVLGLDEEVLVFSDANALYRSDAIRMLVRNFSDPDVGCVVGKLSYVGERSYVGRGESLYWRYEQLLNRLESALGSVLVGTGTILAVRRDLFTPLLGDVANDFQIPAHVAARAYDVVYEPDAVAVERTSSLSREEFARKRRIVLRGLTGFASLRGELGGRFRIFQYVSRKLLRWCAGPLLAAAYAANALLLANPYWLAFFVLQNVFYFLALAGSVLRRGGVQSRILYVPFYYVLVNTAALSAIVLFLRGARFSSWEKAETTRVTLERPETPPRLRVIDGGKDSPARARRSSGNLEGIT